MSTRYLIKLYFTNLDENLNTKQQAQIAFPDVYADDKSHAELLAQHLEKRLGADSYEVF